LTTRTTTSVTLIDDLSVASLASFIFWISHKTASPFHPSSQMWRKSWAEGAFLSKSTAKVKTCKCRQ